MFSLCVDKQILQAHMRINNVYPTMFWLFFLSLFSKLCLAADTISADQTLYGIQTIDSAGGNFTLGLFSPGKSSNYYLGIWYKKVRVQTVVWVANRETPILDKNSAQLKILEGNLVLLNGSGIEIWSTDLNSTTSNKSVVAVLLDDGNLVLRDGLSNVSIWESFDNPTHTWLPGGKIAYDKRKKKNQLLTSWKNSEDPAAGLFSLELDPIGKQYIIKWNGTEQYWTSGAWHDPVFTLVPEMSRNSLYNFSYIDNANESYFTYSLYNPSLISRFILDVSGQIKQLSWVSDSEWILFWSRPAKQCEVYTYCGAFGRCNENSSPFCSCLEGFKIRSDNDWNLNDYSGGCVREINLQCENNGALSNGEKDKFFMHQNVRLPRYSKSLTVGNAGECESSCLNDCSCSAYAYDENGCSLLNGEILNLQQLAEGDSTGRTIYIKLAASSAVFSGKDNKGVLVGAIVGAVAAVLVILAIILVIMWKRRQMVGTSKMVDGSLWAFGYKDLQNATKNFSDKLGGGGFGSVFKGTLPDSSVIAVKKLEGISQGEKQFRTEVTTIGTIQHVNLIRLRGFCSEGSKKMLVYDYMENGSLDSHLFNAKETKILDWLTRYQIALGIARGLTYLHEKCRNCIIHCDIKPENILLDAELCAKVADFGLAKLVGRDFSRVLTTMRGTRGYLAPEWLSGVAITAKADVYSYGMMLFELVSGRRNSEPEDEKVKFFPSLAARVIVDGGDILGLLDPSLSRNAEVEEVLNICKIACWCIQANENIRPSMGHVVQILEGAVDVKLPPIPHSLQMLVESRDSIVFFTDSSSVQILNANSTSTLSASPPSKVSPSSTN